MANCKSRPILASFIAALAMVAPLAAMSVIEMNSVPIALSSGEVDDAGMRGAAVTIMALPFIYILCCVLCHTAAYLLFRFNLRKLHHFVIFTSGVSLVLALFGVFFLSDIARFGWTDLVTSFLIAAAALMAIGNIGAIVWWWIAGKPYNLQFDTDTQACRSTGR